MLSKSPNGAILLHSPGRKPWVNRFPHLLSPVGAAQPQRKADTRTVSAAPTELDITFRSCVPRVSFRALPSFHPGLCRSVALAGLVWFIEEVSSLKALIMRLNVDEGALFL